MGGSRAAIVLSQDKAVPQLSPNSSSSRDKPCGNALRGCGRFAARRWPVVAVLLSLVASAAGPSLGFGLNLSRSAPRGLYQTVAAAPARGTLVVACLPPAVAAFGRARGYLGAGDCPGQTQPVLKRVGAVAGDVIALGRDIVTVDGVRVLAQPIEAVDSAARPLPHVRFGSYRVGDGDLWLFGLSSSQSWDSRYFGPVGATAVRGVVRPVLTLG
jgi:conjugative transfer signal peptidase TraF